MIAVRGGAGLGDAIYVRCVAQYLIAQGQKVEVCTHWPNVFAGMGCAISGFRRQDIDVLAHYYNRRGERTTQWEDVCINARVPTTTSLEISWKPKGSIGEDLRTLAEDRPLVVVSSPRAPFARTDGFGRELLPLPSVFRRTFEELKARAFVVQVGIGKVKYKLGTPDVDCINHTTPDDLLDILHEADLIVGQPSYIIPVAESFSKRALTIWSRRASESNEIVIRQITPEKIIHKKDLVSAIYDDAGAEVIRGAVCRSLGSCEDVQGSVGRDRRIGSVCDGEPTRVHRQL